MKSNDQDHGDREPLETYILNEKRRDPYPGKNQRAGKHKVPQPGSPRDLVAEKPEEEMENGSFIETCVQIRLHIKITGIIGRMSFCPNTRQDLGLISLAILIALVYQHYRIQQQRACNILPLYPEINLQRIPIWRAKY